MKRERGDLHLPTTHLPKPRPGCHANFLSSHIDGVHSQRDYHGASRNSADNFVSIMLQELDRMPIVDFLGPILRFE